MDLAPPFVVAAAGHPSLDGAIAQFCAELRAETRWFGRRGAAAPKPSTALVGRLAAGGPGIRRAAVQDGTVIGLALLDLTVPDGAELLVAVAAPYRRQGVALELGQAVVARAHDIGVPRIVMHTSYRGRDLRDLGARLGFQVYDLGGGRLDLVRVLTPDARSA